MVRRFRLALAASALFAMLVAVSPVAAGGGAAYGACVANHTRAEGGFREHNPGMHRGFAGWGGSCEHA